MWCSAMSCQVIWCDVTFCLLSCHGMWCDLLQCPDVRRCDARWCQNVMNCFRQYRDDSTTLRLWSEDKIVISHPPLRRPHSSHFGCAFCMQDTPFGAPAIYPPSFHEMARLPGKVTLQLCSTFLCSILLYYSPLLLCSTILYSTLLYSTLLFARFSTLLYSSLPFSTSLYPTTLSLIFKTPQLRSFSSKFPLIIVQFRVFCCLLWNKTVMNHVFFRFTWCFLFLPWTKAKHLRSFWKKSCETLKPCTLLNASAPINSISYPDAWAFLNRVCSGAGKEGVPPEAVADWQAGSAPRAHLLTDFVQKIYAQGAPQSSNVLRLEAWVRIKRATSAWRKLFEFV